MHDLIVRGGHEAAGSGVQGLSPQAGDHAARSLAQGDTGGEMNAVAKVPIGHVGGAPAGRDPGQRQGRGQDTRPERRHETRLSQHPDGLELFAIGIGGVEVDVHQASRC